MAIVCPNSPELEVASTLLLPSFRNFIGVSKVARNDESNVFGDILDTIDEEDWFDGLVNQTMRKTSTRRLVPTASGLEEHHLSSSNSDDRPIGIIMVTVEKKVAVKGRKRPSTVEEEEAEEDIPPPRKKNEKPKDAGTSETPVIVASSIE